MHHRGLSTARNALEVTWLLARSPDGVRADEVATRLGKSVSTAYNVLASLCEEAVAVRHPGGRYRLAPAFRDAVVESAPRSHGTHDFARIADELLVRTHKRSYLAALRDGALRIVLERGQQGIPKVPGLEPRSSANAHALALGKVVLALVSPEVVAGYLRSPGLRRFTAHTITDPDMLRAELATVRSRGYAVDREEFDDDFCCIAAPVRDAQRPFLGVIGISMTRRAFDDEHETLAKTVVEVAATAAGGPSDVTPLRPSGVPESTRFQASAETDEVLDSSAEARVTCSNGSTVP